jgi:fibronectin type 3 domain-containing protein
MDEIYNELKSNWRRNKNYDVGRYCVKVSQKNEDDFTACLGMARLAYEELKTEW